MMEDRGPVLEAHIPIVLGRKCFESTSIPPIKRSFLQCSLIEGQQSFFFPEDDEGHAASCLVSRCKYYWDLKKRNKELISEAVR